ncbi:MAG: LysM peptidoglycan-binding domain-containing protein, partial [Candidatus Hydrogenedentota bacterium]
SEDIDVYSEEIDKAIENYFSNLSKQPELAEEENRLIDQLSIEEDADQDTVQETENPEEKAKLNIKTKDADATGQKKNSSSHFHIVHKGESLWRIARKYGLPLYTLTSANPDKATRMIRPGDKIFIPEKAGVYHIVKKGETLSSIAKKYKVNMQKIREENKLTSNIIRIRQKLFIPGAKPLPIYRLVKRKLFQWPIRGRITSRFGWRKNPITGKRQFHTGLDIGARYGSTIRAAGSGVVVYAGNGGSYGNLVILKHRGNYLTAYAHCSKILVKKGQAVRKGQRIAKVGSTGLSTGSHLHFEVRRGRKKINPYKVFQLTKKVRVPSA